MPSFWANLGFALPPTSQGYRPMPITTACVPGFEDLSTSNVMALGADRHYHNPIMQRTFFGTRAVVPGSIWSKLAPADAPSAGPRRARRGGHVRLPELPDAAHEAALPRGSPLGLQRLRRTRRSSAVAPMHAPRRVRPPAVGAGAQRSPRRAQTPLSHLRQLDGDGADHSGAGRRG